MTSKPSKPRLDKKTGARFAWRKSGAYSRTDAEEFGPGKAGVVFCSEGDAAYYDKSWHHDLEKYRALSEEKAVAFKLCPFHIMKKNRQWEGEVRLMGIPEDAKSDMLRAAENISSEARRRDPMHGILDIATKNTTTSIYTSENQLAQRIAKRIQESHKHHVAHTIHRAAGSDAVLITLSWKS